MLKEGKYFYYAAATPRTINTIPAIINIGTAKVTSPPITKPISTTGNTTAVKIILTNPHDALKATPNILKTNPISKIMNNNVIIFSPPISISFVFVFTDYNISHI